MQYDFIQMQKHLNEVQKESRYMHTLGVAYTCANLAMCYGEDMIQAYVAGLLHDCAKHMSSQQLIDFCIERNVEISDAQKEMPFLLHGKVGSFIAKDVYGVDDEAILSSIEWHTTGRPNMSMLEKIVFVADYIEPHRDKAPNLKWIRKISFENIDKSVCIISKQILDYLKDQVIDEATLKTYNFYRTLVDGDIDNSKEVSK